MASPPAEGPPPRPPVVLVVDDEPDIRVLVRKALQLRFRADVHEAANAQEALACLDRFTPELIISDVRMPGMSGIDFLTEARRRLPTCGAILMTGYADMPMALQSINEAKVDRILTKPFRMPTLLDAVDEIVRRRRERAEEARGLAASFHGLRRPPPQS